MRTVRKAKSLTKWGSVQHLQKMLEFGFPISVNVIETIVDDPIGVRLGIDINTRHNTDTLSGAVT